MRRGTEVFDAEIRRVERALHGVLNAGNHEVSVNNPSDPSRDAIGLAATTLRKEAERLEAAIDFGIGTATATDEEKE